MYACTNHWDLTETMQVAVTTQMMHSKTITRAAENSSIMMSTLKSSLVCEPNIVVMAAPITTSTVAAASNLVRFSPRSHGEITALRHSVSPESGANTDWGSS